MALAPEIQTYVDSLKFKSEDAKKAFVALIEDPETAETAFMLQADYTKKTQATAAEKKALEDAKKKFDEDQDYLLSTTATYKEDVEKRLNAALKQAADGDLYGAALVSKLRTLAAQYGEDPDELLKDVKTARAEPAKVEPSAIDDRYVSKARFDETANAVFGFAPMIRDFERDYKRTFGKEYDGSITDLVREVSPQVEQQRARGRQVDLFGLMKEKLDFNGQLERNKVAEAEATAAERTKWEEDRRKEIEQTVRSEYLATNPGAMSKPAQTEAWREKLGARERQAEPRRTPADNFKRQQEIHRAYEETAAKSSAA